jgi:hypothetical protein
MGNLSTGACTYLITLHACIHVSQRTRNLHNTQTTPTDDNHDRVGQRLISSTVALNRDLQIRCQNYKRPPHQIIG